MRNRIKTHKNKYIYIYVYEFYVIWELTELRNGMRHNLMVFVNSIRLSIIVTWFECIHECHCIIFCNQKFLWKHCLQSDEFSHLYKRAARVSSDLLVNISSLCLDHQGSISPYTCGITEKVNFPLLFVF